MPAPILTLKGQSTSRKEEHNTKQRALITIFMVTALFLPAPAPVFAAVIKHAHLFQPGHFKEFDTALPEPSLVLMKKGNIDPKTYVW